jgi:hypothetical protein
MSEKLTAIVVDLSLATEAVEVEANLCSFVNPLRYSMQTVFLLAVLRLVDEGPNGWIHFQ